MPKGIKSTEKVKVNVTEEESGADRVYTITVKCTAAELFFADAFVKRGLVENLSETLRNRARQCVEGYIEAPDEYLDITKPTSSKVSSNGNGHESKLSKEARVAGV